MGVPRRLQGWHLHPLDFGNILLNVFLILVFIDKRFLIYRNDLKNLKHFKSLALLAVLFFSTFFNPRDKNFKVPPLKYFPLENIPDVHGFLISEMGNKFGNSLIII